MFSRVLKPVTYVFLHNSTNNFSISSKINYKVTVVGAAGGIGQPLCMLMMMNPLVSELALYDVSKITPGVGVDLSHMDTHVQVTTYNKPEQLACAVQYADVVIVPAGVPRKPGMSRDDLFNTNATIGKQVAESVAKNSPTAMLAMITNPVNSLVPIVSEVLKKAGVYDWRRVFGVTTLDVVRAASFIGTINCIDPKCVCIPVIGGHSGVTIVPLLSQSCPPVALYDQNEIEALTKKIQEAGTEVVKAKAGGGSATLSMAYAGARFANSLLRGLAGECGVVECAYIRSDVTKAPYFATPVVLGYFGVQENLGYGKLNAYEENLLKAAMPELEKNIKTGVDFVNNPSPPKEKPKK